MTRETAKRRSPRSENIETEKANTGDQPKADATSPGLEDELVRDEQACIERIEGLKVELARARRDLSVIRSYMKTKGLKPSPDPGPTPRLRPSSGLQSRRVPHQWVMRQVESVLADSPPMTLEDLYRKLKRLEKEGKTLDGKPYQLPGQGTEKNLAVHLSPAYQERALRRRNAPATAPLVVTGDDGRLYLANSEAFSRGSSRPGTGDSSSDDAGDIPF